MIILTKLLTSPCSFLAWKAVIYHYDKYCKFLNGTGWWYCPTVFSFGERYLTFRPNPYFLNIFPNHSFIWFNFSIATFVINPHNIHVFFIWDGGAVVSHPYVKWLKDFKLFVAKKLLASQDGLEPPTFRLTAECSTYWTIGKYIMVSRSGVEPLATP